jgi:hypothetical protein
MSRSRHSAQPRPRSRRLRAARCDARAARSVAARKWLLAPAPCSARGELGLRRTQLLAGTNAVVGRRQRAPASSHPRAASIRAPQPSACIAARSARRAGLRRLTANKQQLRCRTIGVGTQVPVGAEPHSTGRSGSAASVLHRPRARRAGGAAPSRAPGHRCSPIATAGAMGDRSRSINRPAAGFATRRPEEPWCEQRKHGSVEPGRATAPATRRPQAAARPAAARSAALEDAKKALTSRPGARGAIAEVQRKSLAVALAQRCGGASTLPLALRSSASSRPDTALLTDQARLDGRPPATREEWHEDRLSADRPTRTAGDGRPGHQLAAES